MIVTISIGTLNLTLNVGLGDPLQQHTFKITRFRTGQADTNLSFVIGEYNIIMVNITHDAIWNGTFDNYYAATRGSYTPPSEIIGTITPKAFPGLVDFWYVDLRLRIYNFRMLYSQC